MQNIDVKSEMVSNILESLTISDLFNEKIILNILNFINNNESSDLQLTDNSINKIEEYIDNNSSKWIYHSIITNNPETRYLVLLQHFLDRNPNSKEEIHSLLTSDVKLFMKEVEKFFGLGC